jgi:RimJ/RimL family protein N-acetyltransferase
MLRFALAAGDAGAQSWLGWNAESLIPAGDVPRVKKFVRGDASGPPHEEPDGGSFLSAFVHADYVGGLQIAPVAGSDYESIVTAGSLFLGGVVVASLRGRGIGTRMFTLGAELAHDEMGAQQVAAACPAEHAASRRALLNAGFHEVDGPVEHALPDGRVLPTLWFVRSW